MLSSIEVLPEQSQSMSNLSEIDKNNSTEQSMPITNKPDNEESTNSSESSQSQDNTDTKSNKSFEHEKRGKDVNMKYRKKNYCYNFEDHSKLMYSDRTVSKPHNLRGRGNFRYEDTSPEDSVNGTSTRRSRFPKSLLSVGGRPRVSVPTFEEPRVVDIEGTKVLIVSYVLGKIGQVNDLAVSQNASYIINTGDFGFFDQESYDRMSLKELISLFERSYLYSLKENERRRVFTLSENELRDFFKRDYFFSELPHYLDGSRKLAVPVYTIWGGSEDLRVIEQFQDSAYSVPNLFLLSEKNNYKVKNLRLFGLGGNIILHKLFDNGVGKGTIAGESGYMWTTLIQINELLNHAKSVKADSRETRIFVSYASSSHQPLVVQLANELRARVVLSGKMRVPQMMLYSDFYLYTQKIWEEMQEEMNQYWKELEEEINQVCTKSEVNAFKDVFRIINKIPSLSFQKSLQNLCIPPMAFGAALLSSTDSLSFQSIQKPNTQNHSSPFHDNRTMYRKERRFYSKSNRKELRDVQE